MLTEDGAAADAVWRSLDHALVEALRLGWEAFQTGNIGVGAVITDTGGAIVAAGRNRVMEPEPPLGEVAGCSLAHAEMNALARIPFRAPRELTLTTTLQPCFQCAAAIRMAPIAHLRIAGADPLWDGCHDFTTINAWLGRRPPVPIEGPRRDELGLFATLMARLGPGLIDPVDVALRALGEGPLLDVVADLSEPQHADRLKGLPVEQAFAALWPRLRDVVAAT
ncbi:MAG: nucleoside deaminase [Actinomycetota bacterium]